MTNAIERSSHWGYHLFDPVGAGRLVALVLVPVCTIAILALLGPTIGNVFSNIVIGISCFR